MRVSVASESGRPDGRNEDWGGATAHIAIVLDGLSEADETGCIHGTPWYVHQLGCRLMNYAGAISSTLNEALGAAIEDVADLHRDSCDLEHPGSPCSTVAMVRELEGAIEYLVLSDSVVIVDEPDVVPHVITDKSVDRFASRVTTGDKSALQSLISEQLKVRNQPGGYWIAQVDPVAAQHATTGVVEGARGAAVLSDGAALLVTDFHAMDWAALLRLGYERGPAALIAATRELEDRDPHGAVWPRYKHRDDATAVICRVQ